MIVPIIMALFGLILVYIEFFIPGGIMGLIGGLLLAGSVVIILISDLGALPLLLFIAFVLAALIAAIKIALWQVRKTGKNGTVFLESDQAGFTASFYDKNLIGSLGKAESDLRPSGYISVEGKSYQAVSKGSFICKGSDIQVLGGEGARLIVKEKTKE